MAKRSSPEVNAGSMADIAFLLLIFFLVTTTIETDSGISRKLPPIEDSDEDVIIKQKNIFTVQINKYDELFVEEKKMDIEKLREATIKFLDNGGGGNDNNWLSWDKEKQSWEKSFDANGKVKEGCSYCNGDRNLKSSVNPDKAIISLTTARQTTYATYISVQNEILAAYATLRNIRADKLFNESFTDMLKNSKDVNWNGDIDELKNKINRIKREYPQKLSEVQEVQ